jgi:anti-sigma B factor antagonist
MLFEHDNLDVHQREQEGVVILDLHGHLVLGCGDVVLREAVETLFKQGNRKLILNLGQVANIDISGAGTILALAEQYQAAGGKVVLLQLAHPHEELYEKARLQAILEIYALELDAVNSFFPDRAVAHYDILDFLDHREHPEKKI